MRRSTRRDRPSLAAWGLWAIICLGLTACQIDPPETSFPELTFDHLPPLRFDVAKVEIEQAYHPSVEPPHVELRMPLPPATAAARWARDRLVAAGSAGRLVFTVREAPVIEQPLEKTGGLPGLWTVEPSERYDARLVLTMTLYNAYGGQEASATVTATRSATVPEDASLNQREAVWFALVEKLMRDSDDELEETLRRYFGSHLLN
ncbi:MAG: hypothetical protein AAF495_19535 [Pseudomonadota bacterium]